MLQSVLSVKKATILRNHSSSKVIRLKILRPRPWIGGLKVPNETDRSPFVFIVAYVGVWCFIPTSLSGLIKTRILRHFAIYADALWLGIQL